MASSPHKRGGLYNSCLHGRASRQGTLPLCQILQDGHKKVHS